MDADLVVMGMLVDRRDELGRARTQAVNRLHRILLELLPGGAKTFLSSHQARALVATVRPREIVAKTRRRLAVELIVEIEGIDKRIKAIKKELTVLVTNRGSTLLELNGVGPSGAARLLADVGDVHRFADRNRFASWNGTAPLDASSGNQNRHRLSRAGNRRINRTLHIMAIVLGYGVTVVAGRRSSTGTSSRRSASVVTPTHDQGDRVRSRDRPLPHQALPGK